MGYTELFHVINYRVLGDKVMSIHDEAEKIRDQLDKERNTIVSVAAFFKIDNWTPHTLIDKLTCI